MWNRHVFAWINALKTVYVLWKYFKYIKNRIWPDKNVLKMSWKRSLPLSQLLMQVFHLDTSVCLGRIFYEWAIGKVVKVKILNMHYATLLIFFKQPHIFYFFFQATPIQYIFQPTLFLYFFSCNFIFFSSKPTFFSSNPT